MQCAVVSLWSSHKDQIRRVDWRQLHVLHTNALEAINERPGVLRSLHIYPSLSSPPAPTTAAFCLTTDTWSRDVGLGSQVGQIGHKIRGFFRSDFITFCLDETKKNVLKSDMPICSTFEPNLASLDCADSEDRCNHASSMTIVLVCIESEV